MILERINVEGHLVVFGARTDGDDGALLGFLFCRVRDDDATGGFLFGGGGLDHHAVSQGFDVEFHGLIVMILERINARNESLKLVPEDCNILVTTDLDEFFEPGWAKVLKENWIEGVHNMASYLKYNIFKGVDGYYNTIHSRGYKWRFPVHECLYNEKEEYNVLYLQDKIKLHHEQEV